MFKIKCLWVMIAGLSLSACSPKPGTTLPGYVEADFTRLAAPVAGRLVALPVSKGQEVPANTVLFVLDQDQEKAAVDEAGARLKRQAAAATDLSKGKRREEMAVLEAQERQIAAQLALSESELKRQKELARKGFISHSGLDTIESRVRSDTARLAEIRANLQVARLGGRTDAVAAAEADIRAAQAVLAQSEWRRDQKAVKTPVAARIDDTLYRLGEWVPVGAPVVSLLTTDATKVRFFVPQGELANYPVGARLQIRCDGCGKPFAAKVSYIAKTPEYTPPVIYSQENRARLVFLVEARPETGQWLAAGQPVDVQLESGK